MISKTSLGLIVLWVCICNGIQDSFLLLHVILKNIYIHIYIIFHSSFYVFQQFRASILMSSFQGLPCWLSSKESACQCRRPKRQGLDPWVRKIPWRTAQQLHSSILAWRIPWAEEPGGLQSMGSQRDRHDLVTKQRKQQPSFQVYFSQISDTKFSKIGGWKTIFSSH